MELQLGNQYKERLTGRTATLKELSEVNGTRWLVLHRANPQREFTLDEAQFNRDFEPISIGP